MKAKETLPAGNTKERIKRNGTLFAPSPVYLDAYYTYILTNKTVSDVAREHGINPQTLQSYAGKHKWKQVRDEVTNKIWRDSGLKEITAGAIKRVTLTQSREAKRITERIEELDDTYRRYLAEIDNNTGKRTMTLTAHRTYAEAYSKLYAELRRALGIADQQHISIDASVLVPQTERKTIIASYAAKRDAGQEITGAGCEYSVIDTPLADTGTEGSGSTTPEANSGGTPLTIRTHSPITHENTISQRQEWDADGVPHISEDL
jgi:hypothetical protein